MISVLGEKESIDASEYDWEWNERFQNVKNAEIMISYINQGTFISTVIIIYFCYLLLLLLLFLFFYFIIYFIFISFLFHF